ncbi:MAG TPA: hypothetical protein VJG13_12780 [Thermoanaerobaculia bacterium]|nr:hypothetical protein [Thermoanaerobaculia bacterium]
MRLVDLLTAALAITLSSTSVIAQTPEPFTIRGVLVDPDGKPTPGEKVHCLIYQDGESYAQMSMVDGRIVPAGPKGTSDRTGSFEIKVGVDFLANGTKEFTIGAVRDGKVIGILREGNLFYFTLEEARRANNKIDLGKVILQRK